MATFWIIEKQLVHKLFKVLVPRYQNYTTSFTRLLKAPNLYPMGRHQYERSILELKGKIHKKCFYKAMQKIYFFDDCYFSGNIYPSLCLSNPYKQNLLHNVLLAAAMKEYRIEKYKEIADNIKQ